MTAWSHGLTPEQRDRCNAVLAEARTYQHGGSYRECGNPVMEGWSIYRFPSTINPPTIVRMRYRDVLGRLLVDVDCS